MVRHRVNNSVIEFWLCRLGLHDWYRRPFKWTPAGYDKQCVRWDCMKWRKKRGV